MKLLHSITRKYLASAVVVLVLFTVAAYAAVTMALEHELDERLVSHKDRIVSGSSGGPLKFYPFYEVEAVSSIPPEAAAFFKDTLIFDPAENEPEMFRQYVSFQDLKGSPHKITVRLPLIEKEDMIQALSLIFGLSSTLLLLTLFVLNKRAAAALFAPFYRTLAQMQQFSLRSSSPLVLEATTIDEFRELNAILSDLVARARKEYRSIKEFSENASHELQTPLAIVKSKLDLLIQKENLDDEEKLWIEAMYQNVGRLTQLTKALLLLSQIETAGYFESADVDLAEELRNEIAALEPIADYRQITLTSSILPVRRVSANPMLINILVKNLLSNAVKHNIEHGRISVHLDAGGFTVENTGTAPAMETEKLFDRFRKASPSGDAVGLGLAVVKEICSLYHFRIGYRYANGLHTVRVDLADT